MYITWWGVYLKVGGGLDSEVWVLSTKPMLMLEYIYLSARQMILKLSVE